MVTMSEGATGSVSAVSIAEVFTRGSFEIAAGSEVLNRARLSGVVALLATWGEVFAVPVVLISVLSLALKLLVLLFLRCVSGKGL